MEPSAPHARLVGQQLECPREPTDGLTLAAVGVPIRGKAECHVGQALPVTLVLEPPERGANVVDRVIERIQRIERIERSELDGSGDRRRQRVV